MNKNLHFQKKLKVPALNSVLEHDIIITHVNPKKGNRFIKNEEEESWDVLHCQGTCIMERVRLRL